MDIVYHFFCIYPFPRIMLSSAVIIMRCEEYFGQCIEKICHMSKCANKNVRPTQIYAYKK